MPDYAKLLRDSREDHAQEDAEREEWLERRRQSIGASDAAQVLEIWDDDEDRYVPISEFGDGFGVWASKVKGYETPENIAMLRGTANEPGIAEVYQIESGRHCEDPGAHAIDYHNDYPFISATLDRVQDDCQRNRAPDGCGGPGVLELKDLRPQYYPLWMSCQREYKWNSKLGQNQLALVPVNKPIDKWKQAPPMRFWVQVQMQLACSGLQWGTLCGMFPGGDIAFIDYIRDEDFIDWALMKLAEFWERHVLTKVPPPIRLPRSLDIVKAVWSEDDGETVALSEDTQAIAEVWEWQKSSKNELEKDKTINHAELISALRGATWGVFPNGRILQYKMTKGGYRKLSVVKRKGK